MRQRRRSEATHRMIESAETEFAALGFEAATMDRVAAGAGVSKSHLYYHFDSKDELLAAIFDERVRGILADKERLFGGARQLDEALMQKALSEGISILLASHPKFLRIVVLECFRPGGRRDLAFGVLKLVTDDTYSRFRALGLDVERGELGSAITWFALLPILAEQLIGGELAAALGQDPGRQHAIFESQLGDVYRGYLKGIRAFDGIGKGEGDAEGS